MALVNVRKEEVNEYGHQSWRLYDPLGVPIAAFGVFCDKLSGMRPATRTRYSTVVARFIDYLYEVKVLGGAPVSRATVNNAIEFYLVLLRSGEHISLAIGKREHGHYAEGGKDKEDALRQVARRLGIEPLASGSWDNTIAALNNFLRLCAILEGEAKDMAQSRGGIDSTLVATAAWDCRPLLEAVEGMTSFSPEEVQHLKQSSMLGGVIRFRGTELTRPRGLRKSVRQQRQLDVDGKDFPREHFPALLSAATTWRDRALWTLLLASGIRRSEALNLQWCDIDFAKREVFVLDPESLRYGREMSQAERDLRFKGRTVSRTYLFLPYRDWFFEYLSRYRKDEYRLPQDGNDFVFQYLITPHLGKPLHQATDETLNSAFTSAVERARIPGPPVAPDHVWTGHSLRHAYGVFMLNDYAVPGQAMPGLTLTELQQLMGHKDINSTRKYARERTSRLLTKLKAHDQQFIQGDAPAPCLPPPAPTPVLRLG